MNDEKLKNKAKKLRQKTFLSFVKKGEAHLGGSFSMIELIIIMYGKILKKNDKFILSKSHASFPLCLILKEKGLNPNLTTHLEFWGTDFQFQQEWHFPERYKKKKEKYMF